MKKLINPLPSRTIDELGRIVIPSELRKEGWCKGGTVSMYHVDNNTIILQLSERCEGSACVADTQAE